MAQRQRYRRRRLAEHRCQHTVVDRGGQREAAGEALPDHADTLAWRGGVEVAGQRSQKQRHRPLLVGRKCGEFPCHTGPRDRGSQIPGARRSARNPEQRRHGHGEAVVHQMITEGKHAGVDARQLGDQHHAGAVAPAVDVVGCSRRR
jgi:hypothetical protein